MIPWRWRNRLRRTWTRMSRLPVPRSAAGSRRQPPYRKLFLVGAPRSGTTWTNTIFALHPQVMTETESLLYPRVMDLLRTHGARKPQAWMEILGSYRAHQRDVVGIHRYASERTFRRILDDARESVAACPTWTDDDAANYIIRRVIDHFFYAHGGSPKHLFVEKTPIHVNYGREILRTFREAKVIHVLRDGRDVCASLEVRATEADWAPTWRLRQIRIWKQFVEAGMDLLEDTEFRGRVELVRYEEMKHDPVGQIARLFDFAELPATPRLVRRVARQTDFRRHRKAGPGKHNNKGVVGSWRNFFSEEDLRLFDETAGNLFRRCGYHIEQMPRAA
jgi:hypothetical protein